MGGYLLQCLALEAGQVLPEVTGIKLIQPSDLSGEETPAKRRVGHNANAQLSAGGHNLCLHARTHTAQDVRLEPQSY